MSNRASTYVRQHHLGLIAIFVALSGTAYAADGPLAGQNQVGSEDIINAEVTNQDLANNAVGSDKINDGAVRTGDVANDTTGNALQGIDIANGALTGEDIADESVSASDIGIGAIGDDEIATGAVRQDEIATNGVGAGEILSSSVGTSEVAFNSLTQSDIATNGVSGTEIANSSVRSADINNSSVGGADLPPLVTRSNTITIVTSGLHAVTAGCNVGERMLSGGWDWSPGRVDNDQTFIIDAQRTSASAANPGNAWTVVGNVGGIQESTFSVEPTDLTAEAYCLPAGA